MLHDKLMTLFPDAKFGDWVIIERNGVQSILRWNRPEPQPSQATLDAISPLSIARAARWEYIKRRRQQALDGGVDWNGHRWDTEEDDINRVARTLTSWQRALSLPPQAQAQLPAAVPTAVSWTTKANQEVALSVNDLAQLDAVINLHIGSCFEIAKALRAQINAATTEAAVNAIDWPS